MLRQRMYLAETVVREHLHTKVFFGPAKKGLGVFGDPRLQVRMRLIGRDQERALERHVQRWFVHSGMNSSCLCPSINNLAGAPNASLASSRASCSSMAASFFLGSTVTTGPVSVLRSLTE